MAWRPNDYFVEGILDNTEPGKVTGWMKFVGKEERVVFELEGNFHRDIRGAKVRLIGNPDCNQEQANQYMQGFAQKQTGKVGDMTAGKQPQDYVDYPYFEWYSEENGRVVLELEPDQVELLTRAIPTCESDPISRKDQAENMAQFLCETAAEFGIPEKQAVTTGNTIAVEQAKKVVANNKIRGMKLLPKQIREKLPELYAQDGKGGKAIVYVKFFMPSGSWTWFATEGSSIKDSDDNETDFHFFGLVDGHCKELGYFSLKELEEVTGPMGLPIERDLYWQPKTLDQIAPELFKSTNPTK